MTKQSKTLLELFWSKKTNAQAAKARRELGSVHIGDVEFLYGNQEIIAYTNDRTFVWDINNYGQGWVAQLFSITDENGKEVDDPEEDELPAPAITAPCTKCGADSPKTLELGDRVFFTCPNCKITFDK